MSLSHQFGRSTAWIVDRPVWAYLFLLLMSAVATVGYLAPERVRSFFQRPPVKVATAVANQAAPAAEQKKPRPNVEALDMTRSHAVLVIESDDIFTPAGAKALRHMIAELEAIPYVRNVLWMDRVPVLNIFGLRAVVSQIRGFTGPFCSGTCTRTQPSAREGTTVVARWSDADCAGQFRLAVRHQR